MTLELILFSILAFVAVSAAIGMLLSSNAVYSALFLILNLVTIAMFYLLLKAPFIAMVQITVYAGAIMVLFLFVIMLLGTEKTRVGQAQPWQRPLALFLGVVLLLESAIIVFRDHLMTSSFLTGNQVSDGFGTPVSIGKILFTEYLLPFEITSVLLLVAMIGAIFLTKGPQRKGS